MTAWWQMCIRDRADAYATALFAMDPVRAERAAERVGVELTLVKA